MTMNTPLIFDIKRCSFEDGPGIRTTVFFKGCNLDCGWCHNPESKRPEQEAAYFVDQCIACGACAEGNAPEICPTRARRVYGKHYSELELLDIIASDRAYFEASDGGVTFSGGECMLYPEFLASIAGLCHNAGISVAIDTAGNVPWTHFERILPSADLFLYDLKCITPERHKLGTGHTNERILENLERLIRTGKQILIRTPVIPDFNDDAELERIRAYCADRKLPLEELAYHSFGLDKLRALRAARAAR